MAVPTAALTARSRGNPRAVAATALRRQPRRAPIACAAAVGPTAEPAAVGLSRSGALRYAPARERGHIELAYLRSADQARFDGYITHSTDAPARRPHSWSAAVSGPGAQLADASDEETYGDRRFHSTVAIAPDGTGRAGFHCARTRSCPGGRLGIVGRLKPPARPAPRSDREESA